MISIRKYLDGVAPADAPSVPKLAAVKRGASGIVPAMVQAYRDVLSSFGHSAQEACPAMGGQLQQDLNASVGAFADDLSEQAISNADRKVRDHIANWGKGAAKHYQRQVDEVKEILIAMARTVESVGQRDKRCALQINEVTSRLKMIATFEDLNLVRASIEKSATELKESFERMAAEGKAVLDSLECQVNTYQTKLEEAEQLATRDSLTGLYNRLWIEGELERRIKADAQFCAAILDIDDFKGVNDAHGHLAGDDLLCQFANELRSASRSTDVIGRWGGDEFILLLGCELASADVQMERMAKWVCGSYKIQNNANTFEVAVRASIGLAEHQAGEGLSQLLDRADAAMYAHKAASRTAASRR